MAPSRPTTLNRMPSSENETKTSQPEILTPNIEYAVTQTIFDGDTPGGREENYSGYVTVYGSGNVVITKGAAVTILHPAVGPIHWFPSGK